MLSIVVLTGEELFDEETNEFTNSEKVVLRLEHSLASLSKWESKWKKPFLSTTAKTPEEVLSYIECMILNEDFPTEALSKLSEENVLAINAYLNDSHTATFFSNNPKPSKEIITSELIYFWLMSAGIDLEVQHWHLSRMFTLLRIYAAKNEKPKKGVPDKDELAERRRLNRERRAKYNSKG